MQESNRTILAIQKRVKMAGNKALTVNIGGDKSSAVDGKEIASLRASDKRFQGKNRADLDWTRKWFKETHPLCLKCARECKQSAKTKIIICPQFKELCE